MGKNKQVVNGYSIFIDRQLGEMKRRGQRTPPKPACFNDPRFSDQWANLSPEEKEVYNEEAKRIKKQRLSGPNSSPSGGGPYFSPIMATPPPSQQQQNHQQQPRQRPLFESEPQFSPWATVTTGEPPIQWGPIPSTPQPARVDSQRRYTHLSSSAHPVLYRSTTVLLGGGGGDGDGGQGGQGVKRTRDEREIPSLPLRYNPWRRACLIVSDSFITSAVDREALKSRIFLFAASNVMLCREHKDRDAEYFPLELGVVKWSLAAGLISRYHEFIDSGPVPVGWAAEAYTHRDKTHRIPLEDFGPAMTNYGVVLANLRRYLLESAAPGDRDAEHADIVLLMQEDMIPDVVGSIDWLQERVATEERWSPEFLGRLKFMPLTRALNAFYKVLNGGVGKKPAEIESDLQRADYAFHHETNCDFHNHQDNDCCALGRARRNSYAFSKLLCGKFGVVPRRGSHIPEERLSISAEDFKPKKEEPPAQDTAQDAEDPEGDGEDAEDASRDTTSPRAAAQGVQSMQFDAPPMTSGVQVKLEPEENATAESASEDGEIPSPAVPATETPNELAASPVPEQQEEDDYAFLGDDDDDDVPPVPADDADQDLYKEEDDYEDDYSTRRASPPLLGMGRGRPVDHGSAFR